MPPSFCNFPKVINQQPRPLFCQLPGAHIGEKRRISAFLLLSLCLFTAESQLPLCGVVLWETGWETMEGVWADASLLLPVLSKCKYCTCATCGITCFCSLATHPSLWRPAFCAKKTVGTSHSVWRGGWHVVWLFSRDSLSQLVNSQHGPSKIGADALLSTTQWQIHLFEHLMEQSTPGTVHVM